MKLLTGYTQGAKWNEVFQLANITSADVVCIQESGSGPSQMSEFKGHGVSSLKYGCFNSGTNRRPTLWYGAHASKDGRCNLTTLYRVQDSDLSIESNVFYYQKPTSEDSDLMDDEFNLRPVLAVRFGDPFNPRLVIANIHCPSGRNAAQLRIKYCRNIFDRFGYNSWMCFGDFNSNLEDAGIQGQFTSVAAHGRARLSQWTFASPDEATHSARDPIPSNQYDFVCGTYDTLGIAGKKIIGTVVTGVGPISDHYPVLYENDFNIS